VVVFQATMPPRADPNAEIVLYLRVKGGIIPAPNALGPKIGPYGLPPKVVGEKIHEATQGYKGIRVKVRIVSKNRQPTVSVVPTASSLLVKALGEGPRTIPKGQPLLHTGTVKFDTVLDIAKELRANSFALKYAGTVLEVLGSARSVGCKVEYKGTVYSPAEITEMVKAGDIEIPEYNVPYQLAEEQETE
ncbi:LSU ribosomal protein L11P, partial [Giardia duodenalis]